MNNEISIEITSNEIELNLKANGYKESIPLDIPPADSYAMYAAQCKEYAELAKRYAEAVNLDKIVNDVYYLDDNIIIKKGNDTETKIPIISSDIIGKPNGIAGLDENGKVEKSQLDLSEITDQIDDIKKLLSTSDYIIERGGDAEQWYELYKSGRLRCGGTIENTNTSSVGILKTVNYLKPFAEEYTLILTVVSTNAGTQFTKAFSANEQELTYFTYFQPTTSSNVNRHNWIAEGWSEGFQNANNI